VVVVNLTFRVNNFMSYIHSSPWQDAANMGSSIGDRLSEALINLPLKRQQMQQQVLAQRAQLAQQATQNRFTKQRLDLQDDEKQERERHDRAVEPSPYAGQMKELGNEINLQSRENIASQKSIDDMMKFGITNDTKHDEIDQRAAAVHERMMNASFEQQMKVPHEELFGLSMEKAMEAVQNPTKYNLSEEKTDILAKTIPALYTRVKQAAEQEQGQSGQQQVPTSQGVGAALPPQGTGATTKHFRFDDKTGLLIPQ
jgi:hypothetical protein